MTRMWRKRQSPHGCGSRARAAVAALLLAGAWATSPTTIDEANAQTPAGKPVINVASVILAEPAVETPFPIQIGPPEAIPQQTFLRIRGLPGNASLSEGHAIAAGAWAIPLAGLPRLRIATPPGASGKSDVTISLVAIDGTILSEVKSTLLIAPAAMIAPAAREGTGPAASTAALAPPVGGPVAAPAPRPPLEARPQPSVPVPPPLQISAADRERALKHMEKGNENLAAGNVTIARLFYQKAAELGWPPGALALAATYDPNELSRLTVIGGVTPDPALARRWYERARELGASEAADRLQRLGAR
jgi:hypothetical protein